jgi:hypothetical protein
METAFMERGFMRSLVRITVASVLGMILPNISFSQSRNPNPNPNANFKEFLRDYDGDGRTDVAVYHPRTSEFAISQTSKNGATLNLPFGDVGDIPLVGDYDGDGRADVVVYHPTIAEFAIAQSSKNRALLNLRFGNVGDMPIAGDYDGDGRTDIAIYRPSTRTFAIAQSSRNGALLSVPLGEAGSIPIAGDFDGDGKTDLAVYRVVGQGADATISFTISLSSKNGSLLSPSPSLGSDNSVPVLGDYDGDGKTDLAVFNPSWSRDYPLTSTFYILQSSNNRMRTVTFCAPAAGNPAKTLAYLNVVTGFACPSGAYLYGVPLTGDWDGDGKTDAALYQPGARTFYIALSSKQSSQNWPVEVIPFAQFGDFPLSAHSPAASLVSDAPYSIGVYTVNADVSETWERFRVENTLGRRMSHKIGYALAPDWDQWVHLANVQLASNIAHGYKTAFSISSLLCWPADKAPPGGCTSRIETDMHSARMGAYNQHYEALAASFAPYCSELVSITINWEFQTPGLWSSVTNKDHTLRWQPADFIGGFDQLSQILKRACPSVPIIWTLNNVVNGSLPSGYTAWMFYPGDRYVDAIGMDFYEQNLRNPCQNGQSTQQCFQSMAQAAGVDCFGSGCRPGEYVDGFARLHGKKIAFPEWGAENNDGGFVAQMAAWLNDPSRRSRVVEFTYWDSPNGQKNGSTGANLYRNQVQQDAFRKFGRPISH